MPDRRKFATMKRMLKPNSDTRLKAVQEKKEKEVEKAKAAEVNRVCV